MSENTNIKPPRSDFWSVAIYRKMTKDTFAEVHWHKEKQWEADGCQRIVREIDEQKENTLCCSQQKWICPTVSSPSPSCLWSIMLSLSSVNVAWSLWSPLISPSSTSLSTTTSVPVPFLSPVSDGKGDDIDGWEFVEPGFSVEVVGCCGPRSGACGIQRMVWSKGIMRSIVWEGECLGFSRPLDCVDLDLGRFRRLGFLGIVYIWIPPVHESTERSMG